MIGNILLQPAKYIGECRLRLNTFAKNNLREIYAKSINTITKEEVANELQNIVGEGKNVCQNTNNILKNAGNTLISAKPLNQWNRVRKEEQVNNTNQNNSQKERLKNVQTNDYKKLEENIKSDEQDKKNDQLDELETDSNRFKWIGWDKVMEIRHQAVETIESLVKNGYDFFATNVERDFRRNILRWFGYGTYRNETLNLQKGVEKQIIRNFDIGEVIGKWTEELRTQLASNINYAKREFGDALSNMQEKLWKGWDKIIEIRHQAKFDFKSFVEQGKEITQEFDRKWNMLKAYFSGFIQGNRKLDGTKGVENIGNFNKQTEADRKFVIETTKYDPDRENRNQIPPGHSLGVYVGKQKRNIRGSSTNEWNKKNGT